MLKGEQENCNKSCNINFDMLMLIVFYNDNVRNISRTHSTDSQKQGYLYRLLLTVINPFDHSLFSEEKKKEIYS